MGKNLEQVVVYDRKDHPEATRLSAGFIKGSGLILRQLAEFALRAIKASVPIFYHIVVVALSAGIALSLPSIVRFISRNFLLYWSLIENDKLFLIAVEIAVAVLLIFFFYYIGRSWKNSRISQMVRGAGMAYFSARNGFLARRRIRKLKERQGFARDVMVIGSTGFRTFVDPKGDLHRVLNDCRDAKIMLLHPDSGGASLRSKAILHPGVTPESFREQISKSIELLKGLKRVQKNVRLKLYEDAPFLKLAILGDHIWIQHYHAGLDVQTMPEYMFQHEQNPGALYTPFYQYFLMRWEDPNIPEYDLETDDMIYRDKGGNVIRREKFPAY